MTDQTIDELRKRHNALMDAIDAMSAYRLSDAGRRKRVQYWREVDQLTEKIKRLEQVAKVEG